MAERMTSNFTLSEHEDYWDLAANNCIISRIIIDYALTLEIQGDRNNLSIRIENQFSLLLGDQCIDISNSKATEFYHAIQLLNKSVKYIKAYKNGSLEIFLLENLVVFVPSDDEYESWMIYGTNGLKIVSSPGGELAIWRPEDN